MNDVEIRARFLILIRRGESFDKAAKQVGTSRRAIARHGEKWPAFAAEVAAAEAEGDAVRATAKLNAVKPEPVHAEVGPHLNPPLNSGIAEPLDPHEALAERLRLDARAIASVDASMPGVIAPLSDWLAKAERMVDDEKAPLRLRVAAWQTLDSWRKAHLGIAVQRLAREEPPGRVLGPGTGDEAKPSRAGMTVLEVPANKARPFLSREPDVVDAELVE